MPENIGDKYKNSIDRAFYNKDNKKNHTRGEGEVMDKPLEVIAMLGAKTDPNGSYTGVPINPFEKPIQDVDDL